MRVLFIATALLLSACPKETGAAMGPSGSNGIAVKVQGPSRPGAAVATIGGRALTVGDLQARLDQQSPFARSRYRDPVKMREFVESQLKFEVLAAEAMARGYHEQPEAMEAVKKIIVQKLSREEYDGAVKMSDISDAELQTYYDAHKDDYNKPEMIRASLILIPYGADKAAATAEAKAAHAAASDPARIDDRNHFKSLVAKYSKHDESRKLGGDLRYLEYKAVEEQYGKPALDALVAADKVNMVTPLIEGADAFYIFKRTGRRKPITRNFDAVRSQIRNKLYRDKKSERFNAWIGELRATYKVEIHEDAIKQLSAGSGEVPAAPPEHPHGGE